MGRYRLPIEQAVSASIGQPWHIEQATDLRDLASHPCAVLTGGAVSVFAKLSQAANGLEQFEVELEGLRVLAARAGVLVPAPIGILSVEGGAILLLEAARELERTPLAWRQFGQALARVHSVRGAAFGFERQGYFGPLFQDNRPTPDWVSFYTERRLWPRLAGAIDSGSLPTETIRRVERLIQRLPGLDLPEITPRLLHGDAQKNNFISTGQGAMLIDPAVYYGFPEIDLAYVDYFEPVPADVFLGYAEVLPIDPGFAGRRELWRVAAYLAVVQVEGPAHLFRLERALKMYL